MGTLEEKILNAVNEKLNDGVIEELVAMSVEKCVSDALSDIFSYGGDGRKLIKDKLKEVITPAIEAHDFKKYIIKLDTVLTEIVNNTSIADNKTILENFSELMKEPDVEEIKLSEIFKRYCQHVAEEIDTTVLEACCEDGEPYYKHVTARMEAGREDKGWYARDNFRDVKFTCEEDERLNCQIRLYRYNDDGNWRFRAGGNSVDINSLRWLNDFEMFLSKLKRAYVKIVIDTESDCDDDIEPEEKPEWKLE